MNATLKNALVVILIAIVGFFALNAYLYNERQTTEQQNNDALVEYFQDQMIALAVSDIGQPIEGFNGPLLMQAFPGLLVEDFEGVQTFEGHYEVSSQGQLAFVRDREQLVSSAETTISKAGYAQLLQNLKTRLNVAVVDTADVMQIISSINTQDRVVIKLGETKSVIGITINPIEVTEDSRCPRGVQCVWAGTVKVRTIVESGLGTSELLFELNKPMTTEAEQITLVDVYPVAEEGVTIADEEYQLVFEVAKRMQ